MNKLVVKDGGLSSSNGKYNDIGLSLFILVEIM